VATNGSEMYPADSEDEMARIDLRLRKRDARVRLLFTSPPYPSSRTTATTSGCAYGSPGSAECEQGPWHERPQGKFESIARYRLLLANVFGSAANLMASESVIYVRTGLGAETCEVTLRALREVFPGYPIETQPRPYSKPTQTHPANPSGKT
jgi:hypothetical protein